MNNVMTNGFCELNEEELMETEGGIGVIIAVAVAAVAAIPVAIDVGCFIAGTVNYAKAAVTNYRCKF